MEISLTKKSFFSKRNIILLIIIIILIIVAISLFFIVNYNKKEANTPINFSTENEDFALSISNIYSFNKVSEEDYILTLRSDKYDSSIYVSETTNSNIRDVFKFIESDKSNFISQFPNATNISDTSKSSICNLEAYNYNFYYKNDVFVDVYWILTDSKFYIIDFRINTTNGDLKSDIADILNTIDIK